MNVQANYSWSPIEDIPQDWKQLANAQVRSVMVTWLEKADSLKQSESYRNFLTMLRRQWAVETGILERLYTFGEGNTKTLIEKGFDATILSHEDTGMPLLQALDMIKDQHAAIEGMSQFVLGDRNLSKSYICELHQVLTAHQLTYDARDSLGNYIKPRMVRGAWKTQPNNVEGPDGFSFEFCPPEHVEAEMDRLLEMYGSHVENKVLPEVEAAWLHHQFTLIHPFVDGNGRIARCLATLVFLKANWFPLVITRDDKPPYIEALRLADKGDLAPLVNFFSDLQRKAARNAFSLSEEIEREGKAIRSILNSVEEKFAKRKEEQQRQYDRAIATSDALFSLVSDRLGEVAEDVKVIVENQSHEYSAFVSRGPRDGEKASYYRYQIAQGAKQLGYFANLQLYPAWAAMHINSGIHTIVLFSFHGIGHEWAGVITCLAIAYRTQASGGDRNEAVDIEALSAEPFEITYNDDAFEIKQRFRKWVEDRLIAGLDYWGKLA